MENLGKDFVHTIKEIKNDRNYNFYIFTFTKANRFIENIEERIDYDDLIIKQFINNFGVINLSNLDQNVSNKINSCDENFKIIIKDLLDAYNEKIFFTNIDFKKEYSVLILEILIGKSISFLIKNFPNYQNNTFYKSFLKENNITNFNDKTLKYLCNKTKCEEFFSMIEKIKNRKSVRIENIKIIDNVTDTKIIDNGTDTKIVDNVIDTKIVEKVNKKIIDNGTDIKIEKVNNPKIVDNVTDTKIEKVTNKKIIKKVNNVEISNCEENMKSIKFTFFILTKNDLSFFSIKGLKEICSKLNVKCNKKSREEIEDIIINHNYSNEYFI